MNEISSEVKKVIEQKAVNREISCAETHEAAEYLKISPSKTGDILDALDIKLCKCQLGLFGPEIIQAIELVTPELQNAMKDSMQDNCLPCIKAWEIANSFNITKLEIANACEYLKIKIKPCQLGAF